MPYADAAFFATLPDAPRPHASTKPLATVCHAINGGRQNGEAERAVVCATVSMRWPS